MRGHLVPDRALLRCRGGDPLRYRLQVARPSGVLLAHSPAEMRSPACSRQRKLKGAAGASRCFGGRRVIRFTGMSVCPQMSLDGDGENDRRARSGGFAGPCSLRHRDARVIEQSPQSWMNGAVSFLPMANYVPDIADLEAEKSDVLLKDLRPLRLRMVE
jgi:hypothetical protein